MSLVFDSTLRSTQKLPLLALADYANDQGESIYPSMETLGKKCGMNERTARRLIKLLMSNKLIERIGEKPHGNFEYKINISVLKTWVGQNVRPDKMSEKRRAKCPKEAGKMSYDPLVNQEHDPIANAEKKTQTSKDKTTPPSVEAYREGAGRYPAKHLWQMMDDAIGQDEKKVSLWRDVVSGYVLMGWNPSNVAGMFEYYKRAEIPKPKTYEQKDEALFVNGHRVIRPPQPKVIRMPQ